MVGSERSTDDLPYGRLSGSSAKDILSKLADALGISSEVPEARNARHSFWTSQPVVQDHEALDMNIDDGPIESNPELRYVPIDLPEGLLWYDINIENPQDKASLYLLLNQNYVEDIESLFRFDYPSDFLEWALRPPRWIADWIVAIKSANTGELLAFISAIPVHLQIKKSLVHAAEVNFLCVHKSLRSKRLAPIMIKEITRRVNLKGIFQAFYTAGVKLPGLLCSARYFHRPLNYKKLFENEFATLPSNTLLESMESQFSLSDTVLPKKQMRPMHAADVLKVKELLGSYLAKYPIHPILSEEEISHWLLPRQGILYSYVEVGESNEITGLVSFYSLPSTVVKSKPPVCIQAAYLFYYASRSEAEIPFLILFALIKAKEMGFDVFNCVKIADNESFLDQLKFEEGDGKLNYYIYNWKTSPVIGNEIFLPML